MFLSRLFHKKNKKKWEEDVAKYEQARYATLETENSERTLHLTEPENAASYVVDLCEQMIDVSKNIEGIRQEYEDFSMEKKYLEQEGKDYVQKNCQKEMERQIKTLLEQLSYESTEVRVDFFNGEELDVKEIRCVIRRADGNPPGEGEPDQVKRKLAQVYNLPEGNINIKIQE